jgi:hypothetical protein
MSWATLWAIFSHPHLVTLDVVTPPSLFNGSVVVTLFFVTQFFFKLFFPRNFLKKQQRNDNCSTITAGLPDGLFSNQKSKFGSILEGIRKKNVYRFCDHLEYFTALWYNIWPFGLVCCHLVYFPHFGMFGPRNIWQP